MDYKDVQELADVYEQQDIINSAAQRLFEEQPKAFAPFFIARDAATTSDANLESIQTRTADALISVRTLEQVLTQLKKHYQDTLKKI